MKDAKMRTWRGFLRLSGFERRIAVQAAVALIATQAGLRLVGFSQWKRVLAWLSPAACGDPGRIEPRDGYSAHEIARVQAAVEKHLFFCANCLEHSLALWWQLRRHGIPSELRIGGRKEHGRFEAHAWVESNGVALSGPNDHDLQFVPFDGPTASMKA